MSGTAKGSVTITLDGSNRSTTLPILEGTIGPEVADIRKLYADLGIFTYDPGYGGTAACESKITYIDGDQGRFCSIAAIRSSSWPRSPPSSNVAYLLLNGELPNCGENEEFEKGVMRHTMLHEQIREFYTRLPARRASDGGDVRRRRRAVRLLSRQPRHQRPRAAGASAPFRLIAKVPTIAAWAHKYNIGQPFMYPRNDLGYAENFLYMFHAVPAEPYDVNPVLARAMDLILILHADHEQNASTSTVRLAGSTAPIRSPASPPVSPACGVRRMAAPTRRC